MRSAFEYTTPVDALEEAKRRVDQFLSKPTNSLDLDGLRLTELPESLSECISLEMLFVRNNHLRELPTFLGRFERLRMLQLGGNQFTTLPKAIGILPALRDLWLGNNPFHALPEELKDLTHLHELEFQSNKLTKIPHWIGRLKELRTLYLNNNFLIRFPEQLTQLVYLKTIHVWNNRLAALPTSLGNLKALVSLNLWKNHLTRLPDGLGDLKALEHLDLHENRLRQLPSSLLALRSLKKLYLHENIELGIPLELLGPTTDEVESHKATAAKPSEILDYYFRIHAPGFIHGKRTALRELKMILVGRGEVGKSSLVEVLQSKPFIHGRPPTEGIAITPWEVTLTDGKATMLVWDFGGQEIMHGTHQFFLTHRTLYLVVIDGRHDRQNQDAEYWLKLVRLFGGGSPVLVVMNKQQPPGGHCYDTDRGRLSRKYDIPLDHFFRTDCGDTEDINRLRQAIFAQAAKMLSVGELFPPEFLPIRERLGAMKQRGEDYLSDDDYREICRQLAVPEKPGSDEWGKALRWLADLGTVVSFPEDVRLSELTVLNPEWVTDGIYRVLNDTKLRDLRHGELELQQLQRILPADRWPLARHRYLVDLMQKFQLCFPLDGSEKLLLVPELLPDREPTLGWDAAKCLVFLYKYPVLPHGVLPRFITRTYELSLGRERWRSGVVLMHEDSEAQVRADYDANEVSVLVRGPHANANRVLLGIIRREFGAIHQRIEGLDANERVAVPGHPEVTLSYKDLLLDERAGRPTARVTIAGERVDWPIAELLNGVESPETRAQHAVDAGLGSETARIYAPGARIEFMESKRTEIKIGINYGQVGETLNQCQNIIGSQPSGGKKTFWRPFKLKPAN